MKSISILTLLLASALFSFAQDKTVSLNEPNYNKKKVFTDLPDKAQMRMADVERLLTLPVGAPVNTIISKNFHITGKVVSVSDPADQSVKSVVVKLSNRDGAVFTFTRTKKSDGSYAFLGRMVSRNSGDALELVKENGQYVLLKKSAQELYVE